MRSDHGLWITVALREVKSYFPRPVDWQQEAQSASRNNFQATWSFDSFSYMRVISTEANGRTKKVVCPSWYY